MSSLKESFYSSNGMGINPLKEGLVEAEPFSDDNIKDAEVVGKASPLEKINGMIYNVISSEKAQKLILRRIETSVAEMFYEHLALGKHFISEHDLREVLKQMIQISIPNLESYLTEIDDELEYATDFYNILNNKIAELSETHILSIIQKFHKLSIVKNTRE